MVLKVRNALLSVSDKSGLVEFAQGLVQLGINLISTGGTYSSLKEEGLPVTKVSEITGFPEILGGRVKSLHPMIHGGILARRDFPSDLAQLAQLGIDTIDLVVVNLYPFEATVAQEGVSLDQACENIDIGGPAMIRAAAKNCAHVAVVVNPHNYTMVLEALSQGGISPALALQLAREAFERTSAYDAHICSYLQKQTQQDLFPEKMHLDLTLVDQLRYGENPHQKAAFYKEAQSGLSLANALQHQGKELSFNNIHDTSAALQILLEYVEPTAVAVKHANPCGIGTASELLGAYELARDADPVSIFGGIIALNRQVNSSLAQILTEIFLEVVIAPSYSPEALQILQGKKNLRVLELDLAGYNPYLDMKRVLGGVLLQETDLALLGQELKLVTTTQANAQELEDLLFTWKAVKHVKSNAIVLGKNGQTLGIGAGQMNRITAARIALEQAGDKAHGAVLASDAFFPFPDVVQAAVAAGIKAIIQPGGSMKDQDSINEANKSQIAMYFTGMRHFKH